MWPEKRVNIIIDYVVLIRLRKVYYISPSYWICIMIYPPLSLSLSLSPSLSLSLSQVWTENREVAAGTSPKLLNLGISEG